MAKAKKKDPPVAAQGPHMPADEGPNADEKHRRMYTGASGQMAVMSEFLYRLINVAVPEVDVGDDVFVIREKDEAVTRVQVKQSKTEVRDDGSYVAQFTLPWDQFDGEDTPALVYVLAVRHRNLWSDFMVVRRSVLRQLHADNDIGTIEKSSAGDPMALKVRLVFTEEADRDVRTKGDYSLKSYLNAFDPWPPPQMIQAKAENQPDAPAPKGE